MRNFPQEVEHAPPSNSPGPLSVLTTSAPSLALTCLPTSCCRVRWWRSTPSLHDHNDAANQVTFANMRHKPRPTTTTTPMDVVGSRSANASPDSGATCASTYDDAPTCDADDDAGYKPRVVLTAAMALPRVSSAIATTLLLGGARHVMRSPTPMMMTPPPRHTTVSVQPIS